MRRASRATCRAAAADEGSIIAAVIVTQIPRYHPSPPRLVPGPASMPRIRATVTAHAATAPTINTIVVRLRAEGCSAILGLLPVLITSRRSEGRKLIAAMSFGLAVGLVFDPVASDSKTGRRRDVRAKDRYPRGMAGGTRRARQARGRASG